MAKRCRGGCGPPACRCARPVPPQRRRGSDAGPSEAWVVPARKQSAIDVRYAVLPPYPERPLPDRSRARFHYVVR